MFSASSVSRALAAILSLLVAIEAEAVIERQVTVEQPIAVDSRIKTFVYSENEVFPIVLHYGYQTSLEFAKGEVIQTYSVGNSFVWQISPMGRTLFIKALEEHIVTNMTVITNKRRYYFELQSKSFSDAADQELAYVVRFFYPNEHDSIKPLQRPKLEEKPTEVVGDVTSRLPPITITGQDKSAIPVIIPYDFGYRVEGTGELAPTAVFDDNTSTYFQYAKGLREIPTIYGRFETLEVRRIGNYLVVNSISPIFMISNGEQSVKIVRDAKQ